MTRGHDWTDERVALLRKMRAEGVSFSLCADALGVSRNAVIGKAARHGILGPPRPNTPNRPSPVRRHAFAGKRFRPMPRRQYLAGPELPLVACEPVTIMQLRDCHCRWILDEQDKTPRKGTLYCGAQTIANKSWCPRHYQRVVQIDSKQMLEAAE